LYWINESRLLPILNPKAAGVISKLAKLNIHRQIKDPVLRKQLTPSYKIGCKRILISNKYYPAFNRSNVSLITEGISSIEGNAIIDKDGNRRDVDAIILGTGFHADPRKYMKGFTVTGKNGVTLLEQWRQGAEAYYGMTVNGFPNMFQLVGPNTGLGHNSVIFMIESQVHYIIDCLKKMEVRAAQTIEVRSSAQRRFNDWVQANLKDTVWSSGCVSWYLQGDGRNFTMWPGSTWMYRFRTKNAKPESYIWLTQSDLKVCSEAIKSDLDNREAVAENKESVNSLPG
jgi:cation diffusion facilitator CzcD-associated flavoprotein CzcO